jgi:hypothetical protein
MRLWGGRFSDESDARVADFTRSIEIDAELALDDIRGSIAHVHGLKGFSRATRPRRSSRASSRSQTRWKRGPWSGTRPLRTST